MDDKLDRPICVFILDPYALVSAGLRLIIDSEPGLQVIGDAGDASLGREKVACQKPDVVLLKLSPNGNPGLDVITALLETSGHSRIILLVSIEDQQLCSQAIQRGVVGIVTETQPPQILIKAIKKVHAGEVWIERSMMAYFVKEISGAQRSASSDPEAERINMLSARERQVIKLIGLGMKNKQIAAELCISEVTVRHHLTSVFNKLGVSDRLELLVFANRSKLV
jgi:two-component system, NarL family, nitrate/nitrite response regulator NarL